VLQPVDFVAVAVAAVDVAGVVAAAVAAFADRFAVAQAVLPQVDFEAAAV